MALSWIGSLAVLFLAEDTAACKQVLGASGFRYSESARAAAFNAKSNLLSIVTTRGELLRFDANSGAIRERRRLVTRRPAAAAFSADGLLFAIAEDDGNVIIEAADGKRTTHALGPEYGPYGVAVTNAGGEPRVVVIGRTQNGATPVIYSGSGFSNRRELYLFVRPALHAEFSPDGSRLLFSGPGGVVVLGRKAVEQWEWKGEAKACFAGDSHVAIVDRDGVLNVWDYARDVWPREARPEKSFFGISASGRPDRLLATMQYTKSNERHPRSRGLLLDAKDFSTVVEIEDDSFSLWQGLLLADRGVIACFVGGSVRRVSSQTGKSLVPLEEAQEPVYAIDVASDGTIGAGYEDGKFRLFRPPEFAPMLAKRPESRYPVSAVYACDGKKWVVGRGSAAVPQQPSFQADFYDALAGTWEPIRVEDDRNYDVHRGGSPHEVLLQVKGLLGGHAGPQAPLRPIRRFDVTTRTMKDVPTRFASSYGPIAWTPGNGSLLAAMDMIGGSVHRMTPESIDFFDRDGNHFGSTATIDGDLPAMAFNRAGSKLAVCQGVGKSNQVLNRISSEIIDALITIRDVPAGNIAGTIRLSGRPKWARFDEDAKWCLVGFDDRVEVLDLTGAPKQTARLKTDYVPTCGAWITPGKTAVIGGDDTRVRIYDVAAKP